VAGRPVGFHYLPAELGTKDYRCFGVVLEMGIAIQEINPPDATLLRGSGRGTPVPGVRPRAPAPCVLQ